MGVWWNPFNVPPGSMGLLPLDEEDFSRGGQPGQRPLDVLALENEVAAVVRQRLNA